LTVGSLACRDRTRYRIYTWRSRSGPADLATELRGAFRMHGSEHRRDASVVANGTYFTNLDWLRPIAITESRLNAAGVRDSMDPPRPPSHLDAPRRADPVRRRPDHLRSRSWVRAGPRSPLRRSTPPHVDGRRGDATSLPHGCTSQSVWCVLRRYALTKKQWSLRGAQDRLSPFRSSMTEACRESHRMVRAVRASLSYHRTVRSVPASYIKLSKNPPRHSVHTERDRRIRRTILPSESGDVAGLDVVFAVIAHGVAREWWGMQVAPADVEEGGY